MDGLGYFCGKAVVREVMRMTPRLAV
jgi:hypothetical protein